MRFLTLTIWPNKAEPVSHGYTPATEDDKARIRLGPIVIAWEVGEF